MGDCSRLQDFINQPINYQVKTSPVQLIWKHLNFTYIRYKIETPTVSILFFPFGAGVSHVIAADLYIEIHTKDIKHSNPATLTFQ